MTDCSLEYFNSAWSGEKKLQGFMVDKEQAIPSLVLVAAFVLTLYECIQHCLEAQFCHN